MSSNSRGLKDLIVEHQVLNLEQSEVIIDLDIHSIKTNPDQPRKFFDSEKIDELALSIKQHGLLQPIVVKKSGEDYIIIAGERRYQACVRLNLKRIPTIVRQYQNKKIPEISLIENIQRENLNPIEEAKAYQKILDISEYKHHELALKIGKSRSHVVNILGLLRLPEEVIDLINNQKISMGHARAISKLSNQTQMSRMAALVVEKTLSVREVENLISKESNKKNKKKDKSILMNDQTLQLSNALNVKVKLSADSLQIFGEASRIDEIIEYLLKFEKKI